MEKSDKNSFYKDKNVLVTGGTGFVGTHIVEELLKTGAKIRIPIHKKQSVLKNDRIETVNADLTKSEDCLRVSDEIDYIFHAAGAVSPAGVTATNPMSAITSNLILNAQILQAACEKNVKRFLIFSSSTVYPATDHPVKEEEMWNGPPHPSYFGYGWMRRYLEKLAEFVPTRSSMKIAIVRPTAVYGRRDHFDLKAGHVIPALIRKAVERQKPFEVWGTGEEIRDFLHISDLARGCILMLEKYAVSDPVNIGYGKVVKIKDIVEIILKVSKYKNPKVVFNTSKPTTIPVRMVDTSKAKKILNFEHKITLEEGLEDTVKWYAKSKGINIE
jgi:GDP-L-fucose synthase